MGVVVVVRVWAWAAAQSVYSQQTIDPLSVQLCEGEGTDKQVHGYEGCTVGPSWVMLCEGEGGPIVTAVV